VESVYSEVNYATLRKKVEELIVEGSERARKCLRGRIPPPLDVCHDSILYYIGEHWLKNCSCLFRLKSYPNTGLKVISKISKYSLPLHWLMLSFLKSFKCH
jgi:hypothetical protein